MDEDILSLIEEKDKGLSNEELKEKLLTTLSDTQATSRSTINLDGIYGKDFSQVLDNLKESLKQNLLLSQFTWLQLVHMVLIGNRI